jgi:hypothetical protein
LETYYLQAGHVFWIAEVEKLREVELIADRDQLWAEAAYPEAQGEPHNIPTELWPAAGEIAEQPGRAPLHDSRHRIRQPRD